MEQGLLNGIVLLDLRKAFDLVDTDVLLEKLSIYQCDDSSLAWFKSDVQGRQQCVNFKGETSETLPVTHGVPQGSILGPLLFIIFMNDLSLHVDSPLDMYADDSTLSASGKTTEELENKLNPDMKAVDHWCEENRMACNSTKTKAMLMTTQQKETHLTSTHLEIFCNGNALENVESEKLLGVIVDRHLTWKPHIDKLAKTTSRNIALLRRIKKYLPHQTRIIFYKSHIQSHLDYCSTIWGQSPHVSRIHILQKMALRLIMDVPRLTHSASLFQKCGVMPIQNRVKFRSVTFVYKCLNGLTPDYMKDMFQKVSDVSQRTTRSSVNNQLYIPNRHLCVSRRALSYSGATLYNMLNDDIKSSVSLASFKHKAYKYFM